MTYPYIEEHILPLLTSDQPSRTLYVVGHSLGAGIASVAACYFLRNMKWEQEGQREEQICTSVVSVLVATIMK